MANLNVSVAEAASEEIINLRKQIDNLNREINRKTYIATGLAGLIGETGDANLIHKAAKIAKEADKQF